MSVSLQDLAWHQSVGKLIESLDHANFWTLLVRTLSLQVRFHSWVALLFSEGRPVVFAESPGPDGGPDELFQDYLRGLYLLDPFYLAARELGSPTLLSLADVAPECFERTDYYCRYFRLNVVADEVQFTVPLTGGRSLGLSLGANQAFTAEQLAILGMVQPWVIALLRQRMVFEREALSSPPPPEPDWRARLESAATHTGARLTTRELEVARLTLSGASSKEIAHKLAISFETVKVHRKHVYAKLGIGSQSALFALFLQSQQP